MIIQLRQTQTSDGWKTRDDIVQLESPGNCPEAQGYPPETRSTRVDGRRGWYTNWRYQQGHGQWSGKR